MKYKACRLENNQGKMWHIGINEKDVAKHVILPADPERCKLISEHFDNPELKAVSRGNPIYTGKYKDIDVSVMSTGMGGTAVSICVEELKQLGVKTLIRMGTSGGLQKSIPEGSFVICTGAVRGDGTTAEYIDCEYPAIADVDVVVALREACLEYGIKPYIGIVRSHDAFYLESPGAHKGWKQRIKKWTDAGCLAVENETSSLLVVSSLLGKIRAGSILLTGKNLYEGYGNMSTANTKDYEKNIVLLTKITLRAIERINKLDDLE